MDGKSCYRSVVERRMTNVERRHDAQMGGTERYGSTDAGYHELFSTPGINERSVFHVAASLRNVRPLSSPDVSQKAKTRWELEPTHSVSARLQEETSVPLVLPTPACITSEREASPVRARGTLVYSTSRRNLL